jgi:hypothetical protein
LRQPNVPLLFVLVLLVLLVLLLCAPKSATLQRSCSVAAHLLYSKVVTTPQLQVMLLRSRSFSAAYTFKLQSRHAARMMPPAAPRPAGTAWQTADTKLGRCRAFA